MSTPTINTVVASAGAVEGEDGGVGRGCWNETIEGDRFAAAEEGDLEFGGHTVFQIALVGAEAPVSIGP